jgi:hypothetical protein
MRTLTISALVLFPWLLAMPAAATVKGAAGPGGPNGICVPSEQNPTPCGTGWSVLPTEDTVDHSLVKTNNRGHVRGEHRASTRASNSHRGGHGNRPGGGHGGHGKGKGGGHNGHGRDHDGNKHR